MNKKSIIKIISLSVLIFSGMQLFGQDSDSQQTLKKFGLGMHIEQLKMTDLSLDFYSVPANKLVFTITPKNNFRLEPEFGFVYANDKKNDLKDKSLQFGIGSYGMFQMGKTNIYTGVKIELAKITSEYRIYSYNASNETVEANRWSVGPVIGAEFFLGEHFSIGGEMILKYVNLKSTDSQYDDDESKLNYFASDSGFLVRFYF